MPRHQLTRAVVAPRAGAWIETSDDPVSRHRPRSRSPCGSVDRNSITSRLSRPTVAPRAGAWIETSTARVCSRRRESLPVRERGSKLLESGHGACCRQSLPVRERGSKRPLRALCPKPSQVAPRAGAWIETSLDAERYAPPGRSPCGSVDRNVRSPIDGTRGACRSPCGSVDRNLGTCRTYAGAMSLPVRERGSKLIIAQLRRHRVAPRAGAWIETSSTGVQRSRHWSLPVRERGSKHVNAVRCRPNSTSLPVRERGSKPLFELGIPVIPCISSPCGTAESPPALR